MGMLDHKYFAPECLTISLGSDCNLNCIYCFSENHNEKEEYQLNNHDYLMCISRAAEMVAANCKSKNVPFFLGFQGSGEPLMYFDMVKRIVERISTIVQKNNLRLFSFITSNGCMEKEKYQWVAKHINRICISMDGTQKINDNQRRFKDIKGTYRKIIDTIKVLKQNHKIPVVRTTITKYNVNSLVPIINHFIHDIKVFDIQVEPVYLVQSKDTLQPSPKTFVNNYIQAKKCATEAGGTLHYSGYRKNEKHGSYCNIHRNVLFIGPNGNASICLFKDREKNDSPFVIGYYRQKNEEFRLDHKKIENLKKITNRHYHDCESCNIVDSCVKGCPDICLIEKNTNYAIKKSLRCKINRLLYQKER